MNAPKRELTELLIARSDGDKAALESLTPLVYQELHRLAARYIAGERPGHILQATALVNEAYIRLIDWQNVHWQNGRIFLQWPPDSCEAFWWTLLETVTVANEEAMSCRYLYPKR